MILLYGVLCILSALVFLAKKYKRFLYVCYKTLPRDVKASLSFVRLHLRVFIRQQTNRTIVKQFKELVKQQPKKIAIYSEHAQWTYKELDEFSDKVGTYFLRRNLKPNDTVALLLGGRPEYVGIWLGLAKIRVVTALVNINLTKEPLKHSLRAANAKGLIFGSNFTSAIDDIYEDHKDLLFFKFQETDQEPEASEERYCNLSRELKEIRSTKLSGIYNKAKVADKLLYIYTSGTTGMPKAAVITNNRYIFMTNALYVMTRLNEDDILYDPLPLYHTAGGIVGVGQCLINGMSITIRSKFSASNFWKDCNKFQCTAAQYIGELCRYLLATKQSPENENRTVRLMFGNGLKAQIWEQFQQRFNVKQICEFYGSTEGNSNLINVDNKIGAVGFMPPWAPSFINPVTLVKCDENGMPIRDAKGHCTECKTGEAGVFIGRIMRQMVFNEFVGYADKEATEKKILKDVFRKGDRYFNTGDVLVTDELGYYYFKDRTGDTFRWKGENVATSEVEAVISNIVDLNDAAVYGVEIPGTDGRAGMAAIVDENNKMDLENFSVEIVKTLPAYALPIFLRIMKELPLTGTFKLKKVDLQNDGFDVTRIKDKLYFFDFKAKRYVDLSQQIYDDINSGKIRL